MNPVLVDMGPIGRDAEPFLVCVDATRLATLLYQARVGHRTYEALLLQQPGDLLAYLDVVPEALPTSACRRLEASERAIPSSVRLQYRFSDEERPPPGGVTFLVFDRGFTRLEEDEEDVDRAWASWRHGGRFRTYLRDLLATVQAAKEAILQSEDPLIAYLARTFQDKTHPFASLDRETAIKRGRATIFNEASQTPALYALMHYVRIGLLATRAAMS